MSQMGKSTITAADFRNSSRFPMLAALKGFMQQFFRLQKVSDMLAAATCLELVDTEEPQPTYKLREWRPPLWLPYMRPPMFQPGPPYMRPPMFQPGPPYMMGPPMFQPGPPQGPPYMGPPMFQPGPPQWPWPHVPGVHWGPPGHHLGRGPGSALGPWAECGSLCML
jgi:hypothetical protein